ncbi:hypothetical protein, partial [Streptomyces sp. NPDC001948]
DLVLEFALGTAVVAVGWSGYVRSLMDNTRWSRGPMSFPGAARARGIHLRCDRLRWCSGTDRYGADGARNALSCVFIPSGALPAPPRQKIIWRCARRIACLGEVH